MRLKKLLAVWLLAVALPASAADVAFTARLQSYTSTPASSYLMAVLTNCAPGNIPRVISTGVKAIDRQRFDPDATGLISATITPKGDITCGSQIGLTQYRLEIWQKQYGQPDRRVWYATYDIAGAFDLSTATPATPVNTSANPQWLDLPEIATPLNPAAGFQRLYGSSATHLLACVLSNGSNCAPAGSGGGATLQTNGVNNLSQAIQNLKSGANVTVTNTSGGDVQFAFSGTLPCSSMPVLTGDVSNANCAVTLTKALFYQTLQANGSGVTQRATANFSTEFTVADNAGQSRTDISVNAIAENKVTSLVADLAAKEATANKNQANGYAGLDAGTKLAAAQLPNPAASTLGGVMSKTCTSTDKISAIGNDGLPVCSADQTGGAGGGITTLDTLNAATQTFGVTNDTNVTMTITPSGANHQFALGWSGALAKARQHAATVYNDQSNTFSTGTQDFSAATMVKLRVAGGLTTSANGDIGYDSTGLRWHAWINGADRKFIGATNDGGAGQPCLSNADGTCTFADPITSGNQGAATTQTITATGALTGVTVTNIGTVLITVSGTYAGVAFNFEGTPDGTFTPAFLLNASQLDAASIVTATGALPSNTTRAWLVDAAGMTKIRLNATAWTSGTANITVTPVYHQFVPWTHVDGTISANLNAGANIVGKVGIDQTTPGTTNGVQVNAALPAGANVVGKVGIDQTTPGTTNGVQVNAALPAGANRIGKTTVRNSADSADIDPLADATFTGRINTQGQKTMAASTPVVLPSDQSDVPTKQGQPSRTTGTITTAASTVSAVTTGYGVATVTVNGTYAGVTVNFEFSDDSGTTWYSDTCTRTDAAIQETSEALPSNQTRAWDCSVYAATNFRVRASAWTSGTANVGITLSAAAIESAPTVAARITDGTNNQPTGDAAARKVFVQPTDGTNNQGYTASSEAKVNCASGAACPVNATLQAGSAIVGKVGIDQTTDVTTNGVEVAPTAGSAAGITPIVSAAAESSHVLKASAGNLYSVYVTTGATAGYLMVFNATSAPADGAVTPIECAAVPASSTTSVSYLPGPMGVFSTGITAVFSTTGCFTKTASATAFFHGLIK
jgi:hypothetical protein